MMTMSWTGLNGTIKKTFENICHTILSVFKMKIHFLCILIKKLS